MAFLADRVFDTGLAALDTEANVLHICSALPSTYAEALSFSLGNKSSLSVGAPADATPSGRKVTVAAFTDGAVTASGDAAFYALVATASSRLLAANSLGAVTAVVIADTFSLPAFSVTIPDPA